MTIASGLTTSRSGVIRTARDEGFREEHEFFGGRGRYILGCTHVPLSAPGAGLVICSSVGSEFETNYRREILLARAVASRGISVQRFQYLGTGNSDGSEKELTLESMEADALAATARLAARNDGGRIAFLGTRLGASVAARLAARHPGAPLVLWQPVVDPAREFREIFRARRFWAAKEEGDSDPPAESAVDELRRRGVIDVLGHPIHLSLYESATRSRIETDIGRDARPVLLMQFGGQAILWRGYRDLAEIWGGAGSSVTTDVVDEQESWWLEPPGEAQEKRVLVNSPVVDRTTRWLVSHLVRRGLA